MCVCVRMCITLGPLPCAYVLVSPLYYKPSVHMHVCVFIYEDDMDTPFCAAGAGVGG